MIYHKIATAIAALLCAFASVQSQNLSWTYGFEILEKEMLNQKFDASFTADDHHAFALLQCSDFSGRSLGHCDLKIIRHFFNNREVIKTCEIDPLTVGNEKRVREIRFLKADKVLITWDGKHSAHQRSKVGWQRSPQIISTDSCRQGEYLSIRKFGGDDDDDDPYITVALENNVDVIYNNNKRSKDCGESVSCRLRFDYDKAVTDHKPFPGSDISKPSKFAVINGVFWMENDSPYKYVIVGKTDENDYETGLVYSPVTGYTKLERYGELFSYSDSNGFATLCWREPHLQSPVSIGLTCKWLDGTHEDETFVANRYWYKRLPKTINTPDGNILVVTYDVSNILIEEIRSDSKCKKLGELEWHGKIGSPLEVSLANNGKLCISAIDAHRKQNSSYKRTKEFVYTFSTKCIEIQRNNRGFSNECGKTPYE